MKLISKSIGYGGLPVALIERTRNVSRNFLKFLDYPHVSESNSHHLKSGDLLDKKQDFLFLSEIFSSKKHIYGETISLLVFLAFSGSIILFGTAALFSVSPLIIGAAFIALTYLTLLIFKLWVVRNAFDEALIKIDDEKVAALEDKDLPTYTILLPAKYESEVMEQTIEAMKAIDYPEDKLEVLVCLEDYDTETIEAFEKTNPPKNFKPFIMPFVSPQTKPKTLNMAFLESKGELVVIYDAEIIPDKDQLKKAVIAFRENPEIDFIQTRLDHYNADQNLLTKLFNAEFSFHYDLLLPGLVKLGLPTPLSGHSVHIKRGAIEKIGAWDPYNVTEDCDLGMRLFRAGFKTIIIDSVSREEATTTIKSWMHQRTRWMKGFIQTSIVHTRHPVRLARELGGWRNFFAFLLTVPSMVLINIINLFSWTLFIVWQTTNSPAIQALYPLPVLYLSTVTFALGVFLFTYFNLLAAYYRGQFSFVKYSLLSPLYWMLQAYASIRASIQIFTNPHSWEKTVHGTHLESSEQIKELIS